MGTSCAISAPPGGKPVVTVAPYAYVTVGFPAPSNPLKTRAGVWHAANWNKLREMMRPFGFEEQEGSAVILGGGDGSVITFRTRGEPKLPQPVQDWLATVHTDAWEVGSSIAKGAAKFLGLIAQLFGIPHLGAIAAGAQVTIGAIDSIVGQTPDKK